MSRLLKTAFSLAMAVAIAGCATLTFVPIRSARFVDEENNYVYVDYGREKTPRVTTFVTPSGISLPYKSTEKVRVALPDGTRFVAWQRMSSIGRLYLTDNGRWEYFEEGPTCIVAEYSSDKAGSGYEVRFRGVVCATQLPPSDPRGKLLKKY